MEMTFRLTAELKSKIFRNCSTVKYINGALFYSKVQLINGVYYSV
jgi:hypothetical protein